MQLAQQVGELLALVGGERLEQPPLVVEVGLGDAVDQLAARRA